MQLDSSYKVSIKANQAWTILVSTWSSSLTFACQGGTSVGCSTYDPLQFLSISTWSTVQICPSPNWIVTDIIPEPRGCSEWLVLPGCWCNWSMAIGGHGQLNVSVDAILTCEVVTTGWSRVQGNATTSLNIQQRHKRDIETLRGWES